MKKIISIFLVLSMFVLTPGVPTATVAASMPFEPNEAEFADFYELAETNELAEFKPCPTGTFRVRRNTRTKKKLVNSLIAGGIGAAIGGGIGGGRGALVGLGSGAGGYLVYRYVRDRRGRCVARYVRRG
jgi:hypothetical protein